MKKIFLILCISILLACQSSTNKSVHTPYEYITVDDILNKMHKPIVITKKYNNGYELILKDGCGWFLTFTSKDLYLNYCEGDTIK